MNSYRVAAEPSWIAAQTSRGSTLPIAVTAGSRRGMLTAVERLSVDRLGERWLYRCDCGGSAIRLTAAINQAVRNGRVPACSECRQDIRESHQDKKERRRTEFLLDLWENTGTLYPSWWEETIGRAIAEDLSAAFGAPRTELPRWVDDATESVPRAADCQQRMVYMFPVGLDDINVVWTCTHCKSPTWRCFECVLCESAVCIECTRKELHVHGDFDGQTLEGVAVEFGLSRERIRGIEAKALEKLRKRRVLTWLGADEPAGFDRPSIVEQRTRAARGRG